MSTEKHNTTAERFTKVNDELIALGLPPRLVMLYGKLAFHAGKDGKCFVRHEKLAEEIGLRGEYRDRQVRNLLNQLRQLRLIEWRRGQYFNHYVVLNPDRKWISGLTGTGVPVWGRPDRKWSSDRKEEELKRESKRPPIPPNPLPGICASDDARAVVASPPPKTPRTSDHTVWFEQFWSAYWRRVARKVAEKAFRVHVKTEERFQQVMAAIRLQTPTMMAREPAHRPHAASWLNAERWRDEPSTPPRKSPGKSPTVDELARSIEAFRRTR